jgi:uncharacterized membrane protein YbjE (DUF340 family)
LTGSLIILACFLADVSFQATNVLPAWISTSSLGTHALSVLMLLVGTVVGSDQRSVNALKKSGVRILTIPLLAIVGTAVGVLLAGLALPIDLNHALAVGFGLGYYGLSSVLIGEWVGHELAVIALLLNIIRELLTLLGSPILHRMFGPLGPVVSGGATAVDTSLPIITQCTGREYAPIAVLSGVVLTQLVPILVSVALRF